MPEKPFTVGATKNKITPTAVMGPTYRAGYKMGEAEEIAGVVDDIFVRCLTISCQDRRVVFLSFDLIGLFGDFRDELAPELVPNGIRSEELIVAATHMHSGPDTMGLWGPALGETGYNPEYGRFLIETAVKTVSQAIESARPSQALISSAQKNLGISCYRNPNDMNLSLWQIRFESDEGPIGSLFSYPAQPELAPRDDDKISAGYPGAACRLLDEKLGGTNLFLLGACGGMEPHSCEAGYDEAHAYGRRLGEELLDMAPEATPIPGQELSIESAEVRIPVENPGFQMMMEAGIIRTSQRPPEATAAVHKIRVGDITIFATPGESFPGIVSGIGKEGKSLFIDQINGSLGYFIPPEHFSAEPVEWAEGHHFVGHELESLGPEAGQAIRKGLQQLASQ